MRKIIIVATLVVLAPNLAWAHAFLKRAEPAAGSTVSTGPNELKLTFTEAVVPALSNVKVTLGGGSVVAVAKPTAIGASILSVKPSQPFATGTYVVTWHVVSVDSHPTSGSYKFTVAH